MELPVWSKCQALAYPLAGLFLIKLIAITLIDEERRIAYNKINPEDKLDEAQTFVMYQLSKPIG